MTKGMKSTEFWVGLVLPQVVSLLIILGIVTPGQIEGMSDQATTIGAYVLSGASAVGYAISRGIAKSKEVS